MYIQVCDEYDFSIQNIWTSDDESTCQTIGHMALQCLLMPEIRITAAHYSAKLKVKLVKEMLLTTARIKDKYLSNRSYVTNCLAICVYPYISKLLGHIGTSFDWEWYVL